MTTTKKAALIASFAVFALAACNNSNQQGNTENQTASLDTLYSATSNEVTDKDTIVYDKFTFPVDSIYSTKVMGVGTFHHDEVLENASKLKWFGLFQGEKGCYLAKAKIRTKNVHDPIVDEDEDEKTGWEVSVTNKDSCLILIESLPFLANRKIPAMELAKNYIYPGDTIVFRYLENEYTLFATGGKKKVQDDPEWFEVWNYKLYLTATIKGQQQRSLLVAQPNFADHMINLLFAGDIDGDSVLDLIIDTSNHYNGESPTIYLSRPAENGEVVKPVGGYSWVGC